MYNVPSRHSHSFGVTAPSLCSTNGPKGDSEIKKQSSMITTTNSVVSEETAEKNVEIAKSETKNQEKAKDSPKKEVITQEKTKESLKNMEKDDIIISVHIKDLELVKWK